MDAAPFFDVIGGGDGSYKWGFAPVL